MHYIVTILVCYIIFNSMRNYILYNRKGRMLRLRVSFELFYTLIIIYILIIAGFGMIYFLMSLHGEMLIEIGQVQSYSVLEDMFRSIYFSGVTMLTIGYGDIIPIGPARMIAILQALIGYLLPASFILKLVQLNMQGEINRTR